MLVSINQPAYLPWLGYFERIERSELHIVLDHVQFEKNSFTNRNQVRMGDSACWLTVPVQTAGKFGSLPICQLAISGDSWREKHWRTLTQAYARARFVDLYRSRLESSYARPWTHLAPLLREMTGFFLEALGITTPLLYSSELGVEGVKDELVLRLCQKVGATTYLSGPLGRNYLREELFQSAGIAIEYQDYRHPAYPQLGRGPFLPRMAVVDLLLNHGPDSLAILTNRVQSA